MRTDLYQNETALIASKHQKLLDSVRERLHNGQTLSELEQNGVLHSLQVLIENSIGKAKQLLKAQGEAVPTSAYDAFTALSLHAIIPPAAISEWHAIVGLRNRIVHDYMNIDMDTVLELVKQQRYQTVYTFLLQPFPSA